jgi:hypothetical protein
LLWGVALGGCFGGLYYNKKIQYYREKTITNIVQYPP